MFFYHDLAYLFVGIKGCPPLFNTYTIGIPPRRVTTTLYSLTKSNKKPLHFYKWLNELFLRNTFIDVLPIVVMMQ